MQQTRSDPLHLLQLSVVIENDLDNFQDYLKRNNDPLGQHTFLLSNLRVSVSCPSQYSKKSPDSYEYSQGDYIGTFHGIFHHHRKILSHMNGS